MEVTLNEFFEKKPPCQLYRISDFKSYLFQKQTSLYLKIPEIYLYCEKCEGFRYFSPKDSDTYIPDGIPKETFSVFECKNCNSSEKRFALLLILDSGKNLLTAYKYGEYPDFGPPVPPRAITLIGPDKDLFLKGRKCENQGLGVGAFTYYRRVIENQKNRIFDEILKVTRKLFPNDEVIQEIEQAKTETQFSKAVDTIKHALPQSLLINGQNPLTLLYSALSEGVHDLSDDECLGYASSIRVILFELAEKLSQVIKDNAELNNAVTNLIKKRNK
jgi:hypothetical protein